MTDPSPFKVRLMKAFHQNHADHFSIGTVLNSVIIRMSAALFTFLVFELLTLYARIEGLTIGSALLPAILSFVCGLILWSCSVLLPNKWRWPRVIALTPCIFIFPVVTYLIEPLLLPIPVISLGVAARSILKRENSGGQALTLRY